MFSVSYLCIWWCYEVWIPEKLQFDYLNNGKSFQKVFSLVSQVLLDLQNITDLTFNVCNYTVLQFHFFGIWLSVKFRKFLIINNFPQVLHFLVLSYKDKLKVKHESTTRCTAFRVALLRCPFYWKLLLTIFNLGLHNIH